MFTITDGEEIRGFIGRRNPTRTDQDNAGPKYLNTPSTDLFVKGREMYGLTEGATALAAGATPVLVEGPMDAIAVTIAGDGHYIGVAPLGTAFTDTQADKLTPHLGPGSSSPPTPTPPANTPPSARSGNPPPAATTPATCTSPPERTRPNCSTTKAPPRCAPPSSTRAASPTR